MRAARLVAVLGAMTCAATQAGSTSETHAMLQTVRAYEAAANAGDADALRATLAIDDPRFTEIEDHIPMPLGADEVHALLAWTQAHPEFEYRVRYFDEQAYRLAPGAGYVVGRNEWTSSSGEGSGRFSFVMIRTDDGRWKIIHGHWSRTPEPPAP